MTISEAIGLVDNYRPNLYTSSDKVKWLSLIDGMVYREIVKNHINMNWRLLPLTVSADTSESTSVSVNGVIADGTLADSYFVMDNTLYHILSNTGNVLTLESTATFSEGDVLIPVASAGYTLIDSEDYSSVELLVPDPFAEDVYINYLESRVDKENGEIAKYNVDVSLFNQGYAAYADYYNRNNMPVRRVTHFKL